ncbi:beta-N-acetylhexosaminidase [Kordiimonas aquimaris]|uniref:beta-N-acetylhexosaminidase n=1 Tax=Kordiimonas aquimaris TaxID=707591 RepID=UPI0021D3AA7A|nr:beta-N-acetylhexosaminidase [Kordiimonas aquimaris]
MKPVIFGCSGPVLTDTERVFFEEQQPVGFILFARNIQTPQQVKTLTADLRLCVNRSDVLILIDQEGGRVQRMTSPHWRKYPPMMTFGLAAAHDEALARQALNLNCRLIADDLRRVGINTNCLPLLDVPITDADPIIGDRAFGQSPQIIAEYGQLVIDTFMQSGVLPVMKHIPGHGRATVDSHLALPRVSEPLDVLEKTDFAPFKAVRNCPLGMTAHVVYQSIDDVNTATLSEDVIKNVIREYIGFDGLLMTDDLSMKALEGSLDDLASRSLAAGCDIVLHCNGDMAEMTAISHALDGIYAEYSNTIAEHVATVETVSHDDRHVLETEYDAVMTQLTALQ